MNDWIVTVTDKLLTNERAEGGIGRNSGGKVTPVTVRYTVLETRHVHQVPSLGVH